LRRQLRKPRAVNDDAATARGVYEWGTQVCTKLGADDDDLVAFDKYASAASSLGAPSSAARALAAGAVRIERVDRLVQAVAANLGMRSAEIDRTVGVVDSWLASNRQRQHLLQPAPAPRVLQRRSSIRQVTAARPG
jgi:hypothetical protein